MADVQTVVAALREKIGELTVENIILRAEKDELEKTLTELQQEVVLAEPKAEDVSSED